jgi:hypothetical protein
VPRNNLTPAELGLYGRAGALKSWAMTEDRAARTAPARAAQIERFERQADPDGVLPPDERARRGAELQHAHMVQMAAKSAVARRRRKEHALGPAGAFRLGEGALI